MIALETTTGFLISTEDYNYLEDARKVAKVFKTGIAVTMILNGIECGVCAPMDTTLFGICMAARYLLPSRFPDGRKMECRNSYGFLLELPRTLEALRIKSGDRLFLSPSFEAHIEGDATP